MTDSLGPVHDAAPGHPTSTQRRIAEMPSWAVAAITALTGLLVFTVALPPAAAQVAGAPAPLSDADRGRLVQRVSDELSRGYVFPDIGDAMARLIRSKQASGAYAAIVDPVGFGDALTTDVQSVSNDRHLRIFANSAVRVSLAPAGDSGASRPAALQRVERLPGNIGLIKFDVFLDPDELSPALNAAMKTLASTDALIIDLTTNRGGSPDSVMALAGFFVPRRTLVAHVFSRQDDSTSELWTTNATDSFYLNRPLYILTSRRTFSAGEAAAYHLKYLVRATIVGETTGGGAHRVRNVKLDEGFSLLLPFARLMNVVTHTDWEGTGVTPDLPATPEQALVVAELAALRTLAPSPERRQEIIRLQALLGTSRANVPRR